MLKINKNIADAAMEELQEAIKLCLEGVVWHLLRYLQGLDEAEISIDYKENKTFNFFEGRVAPIRVTCTIKIQGALNSQALERKYALISMLKLYKHLRDGFSPLAVELRRRFEDLLPEIIKSKLLVEIGVQPL